MNVKPCKDWLDVLNASKVAASQTMSPSNLAAHSESAGLAEQLVQAPHLREPEMPEFG